MEVRGKYGLLKKKFFNDWKNFEYLVLLNSNRLKHLNIHNNDFIIKSYFLKSSYLNSMLNCHNISISGNILCVFFNKDAFKIVTELEKDEFSLLYLFRKTNCYDHKIFFNTYGRDIKSFLSFFLNLRVSCLNQTRVNVFNLVLYKNKK